jgi:DNA-directed RNA polymerase subunit F
MREKLEGLDLMKINDRHISKIIDLLPSNTEEVNKIFVDVGLDEDEAKKVIDIVKQYE